MGTDSPTVIGGTIRAARGNYHLAALSFMQILTIRYIPIC